MKRWWLAWGGHVYTYSAIALMLFGFWCISIVLTTLDSNVMFYSFVVAILAFLLGIVLGIMGSHKLQTKIQRRYIVKTDDALERLEPPGRYGKAKGRQYPLPQYSPVPGAHSPNQEDSDAE